MSKPIADLVAAPAEWATSLAASAGALLTGLVAAVSRPLSSGNGTSLAIRTPPKLLTALVILSALIARIYLTRLKVPAHLRHLPRISWWATIRLVLAQKPYFTAHADELALVRADAYRRGLIKSPDDTPRVWARWILGHWGVVIANPVDLKLAFLQPDTFDKINLLGSANNRGSQLMGRNVVNARRDTWKIHRRVVNPAFRKGFATTLFVEPGQQLIAQLDKLADTGDRVDIIDWAQRFALDSLSLVIFRNNFNSITDPDSAIVRTYHTAMKLLFDPLVFLFGSWADYHPARRACFKAADDFDSYILSMIVNKKKLMAERRAAAENPNDTSDAADLLELLIDAAAEEGRNFSTEELRANVTVFFVAGHDTTATSIAYAMYFLGMNPETQRKARAEVLSVIGDVPAGTAPEHVVFPTTQQQQSQLPYLTMVIKEGLRIFPATPVTLFRDLQYAATLLDGTKLPQGTRVLPNMLAVHRAHEYWGPDAGVFRPERWENLGSVSGDAAEGTVPLHPAAHDYTWAPFGGGQRLCLGQQLSMVEQRTVLAMLLVRYEWEVVGDDAALSGEPTTAPAMLVQVKGVYLKMTRRN